MGTSVLLVGVLAVAIAAACRHYKLPAPLILVTAGLVIGWIPGVPTVDLDPHFVLFVVLPPLLYSAAQDSSYQAIRANRRAVGLLAVGLPLFTTAAVGLVTYWTVPAIPLTAALVLGAVVAPPDAISAQAIGRRLGLPRRIMTLLGGESLLNDATSLTVLRVGLAAAIGATTSWWQGIGTFLLAAVGGTALGLAIGYAVFWVRNKLDDPSMKTAVGVIVPFFTYFVAEEAHTSGVIAVVVAGLFLGQRSVRLGYATRLQGESVRKALDEVLEAGVFLLIGLQLPTLIHNLAGASWQRIALDSVVVLVTVIVIRFAWMYPTAYLPRLLSAKVRRREERPTPGAVFVLGWAGMRGVVSVAASFTIPLTTESGADFPARSEIVFLAFVVVVGTLLLQGTSLPWVIRKLGVANDGEQAADRLAFAAAEDRAARESSELLDEFAQGLDDDDPRHDQVDMLRAWVGAQRDTAWEELGRDEDTIGESPTSAANRMRAKLLRLQRRVFIEERNAGRINDEVLRSALRNLDFAEGQIDGEAT